MLPWDLNIRSIPSQQGQGTGSLSSPAYEQLFRLPLPLTLQDVCHMSPASRQQEHKSDWQIESSQPCLLWISGFFLFSWNSQNCRRLLHVFCLKLSIPLIHSMPPLGFPNSFSSKQMTNRCNLHTALLCTGQGSFCAFPLQVCTSMMRIFPGLPRGSTACSCYSFRANSCEQLLPVSISLRICDELQ